MSVTFSAGTEKMNVSNADADAIYGMLGFATAGRLEGEIAGGEIPAFRVEVTLDADDARDYLHAFDAVLAAAQEAGIAVVYG